MDGCLKVVAEVSVFLFCGMNMRLQIYEQNFVLDHESENISEQIRKCFKICNLLFSLVVPYRQLKTRSHSDLRKLPRRY